MRFMNRLAVACAAATAAAVAPAALAQNVHNAQNSPRDFDALNSAHSALGALTHPNMNGDGERDSALEIEVPK